MLGECGTWQIGWGPGSPRPAYYMLYHDDGRKFVHYGTYLTASAAVREAERLDGRAVEQDSAEIDLTRTRDLIDD